MLLTNINSWENLGFHCKIHCKINLKKILTPVKLVSNIFKIIIQFNLFLNYSQTKTVL
jgi:hypothetical protein